MSCVVGVIEYGVAGNTHSIKKAIKKAGGEIRRITSRESLNTVDKIVIPGVGSFKDAMYELENMSLKEALIEAIKEKPTLGICLGMQILSNLGFEYGKTEGLSLIDAEVKPIIVDAKIPHVGFNQIEVVQKNALLEGVEQEEFYFMHSYEVVNYTDIVALTDYHGHKFVSSIQKGHLFGVQFHPEKSREAGLKVFENFINL